MIPEFHSYNEERRKAFVEDEEKGRIYNALLWIGKQDYSQVARAILPFIHDEEKKTTVIKALENYLNYGGLLDVKLTANYKGTEIKFNDVWTGISITITVNDGRSCSQEVWLQMKSLFAA